MQKCTVRPAETHDVSSIVNITSQWQEFKNILPHKLIAPETEEELLSELAKKKSRRHYLVAINEQQVVVGVCYLDLSFEKFQVVRIGNFIVDIHTRGKGVGQQLIEYIKHYCKEKMIKKIWLWTQEELKGAIQFYEKNGFILEGKQKSQFLGKDALIYGLVM